MIYCTLEFVEFNRLSKIKHQLLKEVLINLDEVSFLHSFLAGVVGVDFISTHGEWADENFIDVAHEIAILLIVTNGVWAMANLNVTTDRGRVDQFLNSNCPIFKF